MIFVAPWWNPKRIEQAITRMTREDSEQSVAAYILVAKGTLEDGVIAISDKKMPMIEAVMNGSSGAATRGLSAADIDLLVSRRDASSRGH